MRYNLDVSPLVCCASALSLYGSRAQALSLLFADVILKSRTFHTHTHTPTYAPAHTQAKDIALSGFAFSAPHLFYVFIALFACVLFSARYLLCTHTRTHTHRVACFGSLFDISLLSPLPAPCQHLLRFLLHSETDSFWHWICPRHKLNTAKFRTSLNAPREWLISMLTFMCDLSRAGPS